MGSFSRKINTPEVESIEDLEYVVLDQGRARIVVPKDEVRSILDEVKTRLSGLRVIVRAGREGKDEMTPIVVTLKQSA